MPSRIAARSTTHGTPVKSCSRTRAGMKEISFSPIVFGSQPASARMSSRLDERVVLAPQQVLEQDLQRERQPLDIGEPGLRQGGQAVEVNGLPANRKGGARR